MNFVLTAVQRTVYRLSEEVSDVHAQHARDADQRRDARVRPAGLNLLVGRSRDARGQEDSLLGHVLVQSAHADAVADGAALLQEPVVVIGQAGHPTNVAPTMIVSQPGKPGLL